MKHRMVRGVCVPLFGSLAVYLVPLAGPHTLTTVGAWLLHVITGAKGRGGWWIAADATLAVTSQIAVALLLASIGIYGVLVCLVNQGRREIGIRLAIGATPARIRAMVVAHGMAVGAAGVGAGVLGALLFASALESLLFGIDPRDPATFVAVTVFLLTIALAGSYLPAARAARTDPMVTLRSD